MEELIEQYNNQMFKVTLAEREYIAIFRRIDNCLGFEIETDNSVELRKLWRNGIFKVINGTYNEKAIVLINSYTRNTSENKITLKIDIMIDGFSIGKNINNKKIKGLSTFSSIFFSAKIKGFSCSYHGINEFDLAKYYDFSVKESSIKAKCESDKFSCLEGNLFFHKTNHMSLGWNTFSCNKVNKFEFLYDRKVSVHTAIKDIWHIRNLLSIFSKKNIAVKEIQLYGTNNAKAILFLNHVKTPNYKFENEFIEHEENSFLITYNDIRLCAGFLWCI